MDEQFWEWDVLCVNDQVYSDYGWLGLEKKVYYKHKRAISVSSVHHTMKTKSFSGVTGNLQEVQPSRNLEKRM